MRGHIIFGQGIAGPPQLANFLRVQFEGKKLGQMPSPTCGNERGAHMGHHVDRVNHSEIYSDHGKDTNMVESFFSRLRNKIEGQHHGVSTQDLYHSAWLEDNCHTDNGTLAKLTVSNAMDAPVSRSRKGYWQRAA
jgi:hypothetical protein